MKVANVESAAAANAPAGAKLAVVTDAEGTAATLVLGGVSVPRAGCGHARAGRARPIVLAEESVGAELVDTSNVHGFIVEPFDLSGQAELYDIYHADC